MKNGIYLVLILFLGVLGYFVVNDLYVEKSMTLASMVFFIISVTMVFLVTNLKRKKILSDAQRFIVVVYISLFSFYGIFLGNSFLSGYSATEVTLFKEAIIVITSVFILLYGTFKFMQRHSSQKV